MFINFWYPAARADELADKPLTVRMLGLRFALFRDSAGRAHCLSNVCIHRGGALGEGKLHGDRIACPYHGWQFDGAGACVRIPQIGKDGKIPPRARLDSYPVQERYGLVFVFLGDLPEAERPPLMAIEEWGAAGWRATLQHFDWAIDYKRSVENNIDPGHNAFVHDTHISTDGHDGTHITGIELVETAWGVGMKRTSYALPLRDEKMRAVSGREGSGFIESATGHHGPNSVWTFIHPSPTMKIHQYLFETPVDAKHTRLYLVTMRNFMIEPEHDARMMERNAYVANQDGKVLHDLEPVVTPDSNLHETFITSDQAVARYRAFCKAWENKGWRIDRDRLAADGTAFAIPSPLRREIKGWVIDPVPLRPGDAASRAAAE
jgi:phenylpropionate dioxygenase-like ring-hydroxylating dioxygenase large terminal subunit